MHPLYNGGLDAVSTLQWPTIDDHKIKTRSDLLACRRKLPVPTAD